MVKVMFAILTAAGNLKCTGRSKGAGGLYVKAGTAQNHANADGDTVVRATIDLDQEPVFIRRKKVNPDG